MSADLAVGVDVATGAYLRSRFEVELARAVANAKRTQQPLSLIYVDVDDFQEHHDMHGDERAIELLAWVAERIARISDGRGPIGRIDGDAFAFFLPSVALASACAVAERVRLAVGRQRHDGDAGPFRLTVSVGVAALRRNEPWGNLLEAAENACRKAKQGGRDRLARR
jgi:diguanylate cyclase (GGDEF)-like protein